MSTSPARQLRYLSQAIQLEEVINPSILRTTMATVGITILAFTVWAGFTNINEVARTPGEVVPQGYQQVVQHLEGGLVRELDVAEGDTVKEGQLLIRLDSPGAVEDLQRVKSRDVSLRLQEEGLRAQLAHRAPDFTRFEQDNMPEVTDQKNLFSGSQSNDDEEKRVVLEQITQKKELIASLGAEAATNQKNLDIARQLFEKRTELHDKGFLSDTKYLEAQRSMNEIEGDIAQTRNKIAMANAEIREYQNRLSSLGYGQKDRLNQKLDSVMADEAQNGEMLTQLSDRVARLAIKAPVSGIVKGLGVNTIGAVVRPGDTLMEIVPANRELVVQVKIPPQFIGHVKPGQQVKVKFSSFDFARYGLVNGTLEQISASTFNGENGERYYRGKIHLDQTYVGRDPSNVVVPGMTVMAEIVTGQKTILQYLLKPIQNSLKTAFSER